jgi:hypothetical protein
MTEMLGALGGGSVVVGLALYFLKGKLDDFRTLERDFDAFKVEIAKNYVGKADMKELEDRIDKRFDKLESLLNGRGPS